MAIFQIAPSHFYNKRPGFVIERAFADDWAIPAWEEMGMDDCASVFDTPDQAIYCLAQYGYRAALAPEIAGA